MAKEKEGSLVKLQYDFNTAKCCEVEFQPGMWARTTAREFRSFNGNRRILNTDTRGEAFYESYKGPVYLFNTNIISDNNTPGLVFENNKDPREKFTKKSNW